jgi:two-component system, OmpR family, response regulator
MRLLLAEDDVVLGASVKLALQHAGFAVDLVVDGEEALFMGNTEPYDIVVLDVGLPKINGLTVLEKWRAVDNRVPVVILTARDTWQEKIAGFKVGADDYLTKPFEMPELLARLGAVLKRSQGVCQNPLSTPQFVLDEATQSIVMTQGVRHALTATEFKLLRYMMIYTGQVLSKTTLTAHVYDYDSDKDSNVIEVYVNRLRQLLGRDAIVTRRGQGYVFHTSEDT